MLRRQQASAIVAARKKIVEGAVWMVRDAVTQLEQGASEQDAIPLDADRRATFASNLMTVIASDAPTNPVVNVGTLSRYPGGRTRKQFPLRIPPELYAAYEAWAGDEFRSVNAQIEAVLVDAARRAGRLRRRTDATRETEQS